MHNVHHVSDSIGVYLAGEGELPPTVWAEPHPDGWQPTGECLDFNIAGEWSEAWVMER